MKTHLSLIALLLTVAISATAQTEKGKNFIGGSIGYGKYTHTPTNTFSNNFDESTYFNIMPTFGHFFSKNLAIGLSAGYNETKTTSGVTNVYNNSVIVSTLVNRNKAFDVSPFVRYYVDIVDKFKFFGQGTLSVAVGKTEQSNTGSLTFPYQISKYKSTEYGASISPGLAFFPTKRWAIELSFPLLSYNKTKLKDDGLNQYSQAYDNDTFAFGLSTFTPSVGVNYHF